MTERTKLRVAYVSIWCVMWIVYLATCHVMGILIRETVSFFQAVVLYLPMWWTAEKLTKPLLRRIVELKFEQLCVELKFEQLCEFFDRHGLTTLRNDLLLERKRLHAWKDVASAWSRYHRVCTTDENLQRVNDAVAKAEALG